MVNTAKHLLVVNAASVLSRYGHCDDENLHSQNLCIY